MKQCVQARLQSVPATWNHNVSNDSEGTTGNAEVIAHAILSSAPPGAPGNTVGVALPPYCLYSRPRGRGRFRMNGA